MKLYARAKAGAVAPGITQQNIDRIRSTILPAPPTDARNSGCVHLADVYVRFPDGSLKRPDISLFCREPDKDEDAVQLVPEAVIEVVSRGFEAKDMEIGPPFYLAQGVKDVVVFDPATLLVLHLQRTDARRYTSPVDLTLLCGCTCRVYEQASRWLRPSKLQRRDAVDRRLTAGASRG